MRKAVALCFTDLPSFGSWIRFEELCPADMPALPREGAVRAFLQTFLMSFCRAAFGVEGGMLLSRPRLTIIMLHHLHGTQRMDLWANFTRTETTVVFQTFDVRNDVGEPMFDIYEEYDNEGNIIE